MTSKQIFITQRVNINHERDERLDALDQRMVDWVDKIGGDAIPVPNCYFDKVSIWASKLSPKAIILSGGNNIGEAPERDATEKALLNIASSRRLPVLGICRGMQFMTLHAGGELVPVKHHVRTRHKLKNRQGSTVNSYHEFGIETCPSGYNPIAFAEDGTIEAIIHNELPWEGWMWHPEREPIFDHIDIKRARNLFLL